MQFPRTRTRKVENVTWEWIEKRRRAYDQHLVKERSTQHRFHVILAQVARLRRAPEAWLVKNLVRT